MEFDNFQNYLIKLSGSKVGRSLIRKGRIPILKLEIHQIKLPENKYNNFIQKMGYKNFESVLDNLSKFPKDWIQFYNDNFISTNLIFHKNNFYYSKREREILENLLVNLNTKRIGLNQSEIFETFPEGTRDMENIDIIPLRQKYLWAGRIKKKLLDYPTYPIIDILAKEIYFDGKSKWSINF